jgi:hypothetical protein
MKVVFTGKNAPNQVCYADTSGLEQKLANFIELSRLKNISEEDFQSGLRDLLAKEVIHAEMRSDPDF